MKYMKYFSRKFNKNLTEVISFTIISTFAKVCYRNERFCPINMKTFTQHVVRDSIVCIALPQVHRITAKEPEGNF